LTLPLLYAHDRVASLLAADHLSVMFPDVDTPFTDTEDVIRRLLPYHVLQQPAKDLQQVIFDPSGKGKARAVHKNEVDIEGLLFKRSVAWSDADSRRRHEICDRIPQEDPFTPPTVPASEKKGIPGIHHRFLMWSKPFSK